jgi:hypothetical protein
MSPPEKNIVKITSLRKILFPHRKGFDRGYAKRTVRVRAIAVPHEA